MSEQRRRSLDVFAWGQLVCCLLLAGCLLSYVPGQLRDGSSAAQYSLFGAWGSWLAEEFFEALGYSAYVFAAGWFSVALLILACANPFAVVLRGVGWIALVVSSSVIFQLYDLQLPALSESGLGGSIGAWLWLMLADVLETQEAVVAVWSVFALGVLIVADRVLFAVVRIGFSRTWRLARATMGLAHPQTNDEKRARCETRRPMVKRPKITRTSSDKQNADGSIPIRYPEPDSVQPESSMEVGPEPEPREPVPIIRPAAVLHEEAFEDYELPSLSLLENPEPFPYEEHDQHLRQQAALLEKTFRDFNLNVRVVGINTGPVITQYELSLETGLRVHKVTRLADDIALNLKVSSVRMVAPIPGKNTVGVEVPNAHRAVVRLKEVILSAGKQAGNGRIPLYLGKDAEGRPLVYDLAEMPHLLIAGRTGTGKSVCLNAIILSMLMTQRPDEVKMLMIDPKRTELSEYGGLPHLMHPVVTDMKKAEAILSWAVDKMEERYDLLSRARVRSIAAYNRLTYKEILKRTEATEDEHESIPERMPYIVMIIDEMADLMMERKREVEGHIIRLAQKSRAAGIHLVVATQKPTVDVITGLIKSNLPARICFQVASRTDSRVVLDEMGAEKLLGKGDMLFLQPGTSTLVRAQGTFASDEEITRVVDDLGCEPEFAEELLRLEADIANNDSKDDGDHFKGRDELYEEAIEIVIREGRGSVSLLQRALGIGYGRAARLIDFMAEDGIVGGYRGSSAREVLYTPEEWRQARSARTSS